jgi:diacylglycerol O-acyltransferase / wax synthase
VRATTTTTIPTVPTTTTTSPMRFERHMSDADALMWSIEKDPLLRSTITMVSLLDGPPDRDRLLARLDRGSRLIPRLRQRAVRAPLVGAPPRWVTEADVDLDYHVRFLRAPSPGTPRQLLDLAGPVAMQGFDRARPLWEFLVVEGLVDGRAAFVQKVHHSVTDGVGGMELAMLLLDLERHPSGAGVDADPLPEPPPPDRLSTLGLVAEAIGHERRRQLGIARRTGAALARAGRDPVGRARTTAAVVASAARLLAPAFQPMSPLMRDRSLRARFDTLTAPVDELKAAARLVDGKLNDAFVAAVAGGLRRYHEAHDQPVAALRMSMPISIRNAGDGSSVAGNQFVPARFGVPVGIADPRARMAAVRQQVGRQRAEPALPFTEVVAGVLNRLPTTVTTRLFGSMLKGVDFVTSNVPGAPMPVYLAGAKVDATFAFGPLAGAAANVTLLSLVDEVNVGVNTDPAAIPDPDLFLACLEAGFDEIRKLA